MSRFGSRIRVVSRVDQWMKNPTSGQEYVIPFATSVPATTSTGMSAGVVLTASSTVHTYGSWSTLIASVEADTSALHIQVLNATSATATAAILDIGIGAAGSEVSLFQMTIGSATNNRYLVPIQIPSGSRIAARMQSVISSRQATVQVAPIWTVGEFKAAPTADTYGLNNATSRGVSLSTNNAWTTITSSTTRPYRALSTHLGVSSTTVENESLIPFEVGIGAAGSEVALQAFTVNTNNFEQWASFSMGFVPGLYVGHIPVGSRIAIRQNSIRTYFDANVIGIPFA